MAGAIRGKTEGDKFRLSHGIGMKPLLLCRSGYGLYGVGSSKLKGATKLEIGSGNSEELPPSIPWFLSRASGPRLDDYLIRPCSVIVVAQPVFHSATVVFAMPHLHHRMRCRRGTPWHAPSILSSNSPSLSSEFIAGHYPRTRSGRGHLHLPSHYPEPRSPDSTSSPSFGSVIFTFDCSLNHPSITVHNSVFFHEEAQVGESSSHQEGPCSVSAPNPFSLKAPEVQVHNALDVVMVLTDPGPSETEAARARGSA